MKKNKVMRFASCLLVLAIMTTCAISATFAKYTTTARGSSAATVARWSFTVNGQQIVTANPSINFNLFTTVNDTKDSTPTKESDVADGKIAPGTCGSFELKLANNSEVNALYSIQLSELNPSNIPLQYSVDGKTWSDSVAELSMTELTNQAINMNGNDTQIVYWRWVFEGTTTGAHANQTDAGDTSLGLAAQTTASVPAVTITAAVTATQVD